MKPTKLLVGELRLLSSNLMKLSQSKVPSKWQPKCSWYLSELQSSFKLVAFLRLISSPIYVPRNEDESRILNVESTSSFIRCCVEASIDVMFTSCDVVYGHTKYFLVYEKVQINPFSFYVQQKNVIERLLLDSLNFTLLKLSILTGLRSKFGTILESEMKPAIADCLLTKKIKKSIGGLVGINLIFFHIAIN